MDALILAASLNFLTSNFRPHPIVERITSLLPTKRSDVRERLEGTIEGSLS